LIFGILEQKYIETPIPKIKDPRNQKELLIINFGRFSAFFEGVANYRPNIGKN